jgi:hypothetical protein
MGTWEKWVNRWHASYILRMGQKANRKPKKASRNRAGTELEPSWNRATAHLCSPLLGIARLCSPFAGKLFLERGESRVERLGLRNVKKVQRFAFVRLRSPFGRGEGGGNADGKNETTEEWPRNEYQNVSSLRLRRYTEKYGWEANSNSISEGAVNIAKMQTPGRSSSLQISPYSVSIGSIIVMKAPSRRIVCSDVSFS